MSEKNEGCKICRLGTDLLIASYEVDPELSNDIVRLLHKHASRAGHKTNEGWVTLDEKSKREGWGSTPLSRKWHYFVNGMSLCGKIGFFKGELEQGNDDSNDNCTACKKALLRLRAKQKVEQLKEGKKIEF